MCSASSAVLGNLVGSAARVKPDLDFPSIHVHQCRLPMLMRFDFIYR